MHLILITAALLRDDCADYLLKKLQKLQNRAAQSMVLITLTSQVKLPSKYNNRYAISLSSDCVVVKTS